MTAEQFAYWLQGFNEINGTVPTEAQWQVIKDHLATVFTKVTPDRLSPSQYGLDPVRDRLLRQGLDVDPYRTETIC